jgi:hypothetical protein
LSNIPSYTNRKTHSDWCGEADIAEEDRYGGIDCLLLFFDVSIWLPAPLLYIILNTEVIKIT